MTPTDYAHARTILVGAFVAASNVEAMELIFKAQQEVFTASVLDPESSIQRSAA